jgi:rhodanese-related sulfurtransferase
VRKNNEDAFLALTFNAEGLRYLGKTGSASVDEGDFVFAVSDGMGGAKVSAADAVRMINRERAVLIDVSEPAEYAAGHVAGSRSVPLSNLQASNDLPKNKTLPLVVVCSNGSRAVRAVATLKSLGFENTRVLAGGLAAWREANLPVEKTAKSAA